MRFGSFMSNKWWIQLTLSPLLKGKLAGLQPLLQNKKQGGKSPTFSMVMQCMHKNDNSLHGLYARDLGKTELQL